MKYEVIIAPTALDDMRELPRNRAETIMRRIESMRSGLPGGIKRLRDFDYGYRLRVADYRILFDLKGAQVTIQRVLHRRYAYASQSFGKKRKGQH